MEKFIENAALTKSFLKLFNEYPLDDNNNEDDDFENFYDKDTHQLEIALSEWRGNFCYANFKKTEIKGMIKMEIAISASRRFPYALNDKQERSSEELCATSEKMIQYLDKIMQVTKDDFKSQLSSNTLIIKDAYTNVYYQRYYAHEGDMRGNVKGTLVIPVREYENLTNNCSENN